MKKIFLIILSFITALLITEIIVQFLIQYPKYGVEKGILGIPYSGKELIYEPYSKYWNVEGGNNVYKRNNIGLNGIDVNINKDSKFIFVMGNSFIIGAEIKPELIATSLFQNRLNGTSENYRVLNLGFNSHDPYLLWFLSQYYKNYYLPSAVILVIEMDYEYWLNGYKHPLDFKLPENFGSEDNGNAFKFISFLRNNSAFINLTASALKLRSDNTGEVIQNDNPLLMSGNPNYVTNNLEVTITEFKKVFGDKLIILSIMPDENINKQLAEFCINNNIHCIYDGNIMLPQYRINKSGHLNENGNRILGEKLYEAYEKYIQ